MRSLYLVIIAHQNFPITSGTSKSKRQRSLVHRSSVGRGWVNEQWSIRIRYRNPWKKSVELVYKDS